MGIRASRNFPKRLQIFENFHKLFRILLKLSRNVRSSQRYIGTPGPRARCRTHAVLQFLARRHLTISALLGDYFATISS